jgi:gas vesicle protein
MFCLLLMAITWYPRAGHLNMFPQWIALGSSHFILSTFKLFIMSTGKIVLGIVAGIAAGTLLGVLIAPDKGTETRRKIRQRGDDLVEGVKDGMTSMVDGVTNKFDKLRGKARKSVNEVLASTDYEHTDL